jgi:acyl carrier protein
LGSQAELKLQERGVLNRDEIYDQVKEVLEDALGADQEDITMGASLTKDLEAESIDFLDIVFRLEKSFSTPEKPFKISQGELFPENLMENAEWVQDGKLTDAGLEMLRERMPHVDFSSIENEREVTKVADALTVASIVDFVARKLDS